MYLLWERFEMSFKLYYGFGLVAIASGIVALGRLALGQDYDEVIPPNIVIGGICVVMLILLSYRERRKIARRN